MAFALKKKGGPKGYLCLLVFCPEKACVILLLSVLGFIQSFDFDYQGVDITEIMKNPDLSILLLLTYTPYLIHRKSNPLCTLVFF